MTSTSSGWKRKRTRKAKRTRLIDEKKLLLIVHYKAFVHACEKLAVVGRMLGGWRNQQLAWAGVASV
jgi:hypothetical protein